MFVAILRYLRALLADLRGLVGADGGFDAGAIILDASRQQGPV
jgi:hypothetical protein